MRQESMACVYNMSDWYALQKLTRLQEAHGVWGVSSKAYDGKVLFIEQFQSIL